MTMSPNEVVAKVPTQLLIGGEWRKASSGETFTVENPATGETIATLDSANSADAVAALDAACAVQDEWARTTRASGRMSSAGPSSWYTSAPMSSRR